MLIKKFFAHEVRRRGASRIFCCFQAFLPVDTGRVKGYDRYAGSGISQMLVWRKLRNVFILGVSCIRRN